MFTKEMVDDYAEKLLIGLSDAENALVLKEFDVIDKSMAILANMKNISNVEPMTHALDNFEIELRDDEATDSVPIDDLLRNCDRYEDREVVVPKVVG